MIRKFASALCVVLTASSIALADEKLEPRADLPMQIANFRLPDSHGAMHTLSDYADSKAIVLFVHGIACPIVRQTTPYIKELRDTFETQGVSFLMLNANLYDDPASIREEAAEYEIDITILRDASQAVARFLDLERTAEILVIDPATWDIIYRGEADDRFAYGLQRSNPQEFYLRDVLTDWLADGTRPEVPVRITKGCLMSMDDLPTAVDVVAEVAPALRALIPNYDADGGAVGSNDIWETLLLDATGESGDNPALTPEQVAAIVSWLRAQPSGN